MIPSRFYYFTAKLIIVILWISVFKFNPIGLLVLYLFEYVIWILDISSSNKSSAFHAILCFLQAILLSTAISFSTTVTTVCISVCIILQFFIKKDERPDIYKF